ncbi:hypothetical protein MNBD_UNCLBAC01-2030 [hydrothermal vent metagenome]|uniref:ADP-heptose--lipooligosaccharide heptosyltransferase II n=1 Tax=hydrothermal vent metagenome TaxID=652676 RepID=A0A3B1DH64_9ZZZZ
MSKINLLQIQNILVVMLGGIGNLILMVPALRQLRQNFPNKKITLLVGEPHVQEIIEADRLVDDVIFYDCQKRQSWSNVRAFIQAMRKEHFDLALIASSTNPIKSGILTWLLGIPHRVGENISGKGFLYTTKVDFQKGITHETDGALNLLKAIGIELTPEVVPHISFFLDDEEMAGKFLAKCGVMRGTKVVGIHAGSGYKQLFKRWPKERFARLADQLVQEYDAKILLTGGPNEEETVKEIERFMQSPVINAAGKLTIRETAAVIKRCCLFISNDSGPAHIAVAVDTPLIALFGNTETWRIAPRGRQVHIIKKKYVNLISEDEVKKVASRFL